MTAEIMISLALIITVLVNNILGSANAIVNGEFDKRVAKKGLFKGIIISLCGVGLFGAGLLAPTISIGLFNGIEMTLNMALNTLVTGGFVYYVYQDILKIKELINCKITTEEINSEVDELSSNQRGS